MIKSLVTVLALGLSTSALAQSNGLPVEGELLPGWREADGRHMSGISLRLAPGWKTYWRSPGAGGIPPSFNWSGSSNLASVEVRYPVPKVMVQNGLQSIGYDRDVVFPLIVSAKDRSAPVGLRAEIEVGLCEEVCIPMTLRLSVNLPAGGSYDVSIGQGLENQPVQGGGFACEITPISDGLRLRAETRNAGMKAEAVVIETGSPDVWVSPSDTTQTGSTLVAHVEMVPPSAQPFALARSDVRMTLIGEGRAIEMTGCQ
jgi:DsbC/DsbD-like thiol-disulfide interchange protein